MTIRKIAVPLKVIAATAAEVVGVCTLTGVLDLILCKSLSVQNMNQRINRMQLTVHAYLTIRKRLSHNVVACLWTTLRVFAGGQTCL